MKPGTNGWNTTFVLECHLDHHTLCETILSPQKNNRPSVGRFAENPYICK